MLSENFFMYAKDILEKLQESYSPCFDIEEIPQGEFKCNCFSCKTFVTFNAKNNFPNGYGLALRFLAPEKRLQKIKDAL